MKQDESTPLAARPWVKLYNAVPHIVSFPFTKISMTFALCCALFLLCVRLLIEQVLIGIGWPDLLETVLVSENLAAVVHSSILCPTLLVLLWNQPYKPAGLMSDHPKWWQDASSAMIDLTTGYMIYDGLFSLIYRNYIYTPGLFSISIPAADYAFMGHHIATVLYMVSSRIIGAGHMSTMMAMFLGEFTNPAQNVMLSSIEAMKLGECCAGPMLLSLYPYVRFIYGFFYASIRIVIAPCIFLHISIVVLFSKEGKKNIPIGLGILWVSLLWGVTVGAIPWMYEAVDIVKDFMANSQGLGQEL